MGFFYAHAVFELLAGFFTNASIYSNNFIYMADYLPVSIKTPVCSIGVIVTPASDHLTGGEEWPKDEKSDLKMKNSYILWNSWNILFSLTLFFFW